MNKNITVFKAKEYDGSDDWPPEDAAGFIAWFVGKIDGIPEEHRKTACIEITSESSYEDSHYVGIKISYERSETTGEKV